ncbi:restriction endonuclease subunit S [Cylindrospermopsis raciborskii]|uniref:restriction endonuclease subunit S n=1 Tax=Cylindrospermopsis raciborskii TaxID=77022 RepID=UPI001F2B1BB0|nr:restriction endonuclease subunit S [Cylindrospermopsis raciborskii]UJS04582.1 restriction endonuclease subunit S [Cylindrospermopsis raciborskii KLL07]
MSEVEIKQERGWKRYPAYKDSGVEWLGEIPEGWETKRLKFISQLTMGQSPNSEDYNHDGYGAPFLQGNAEFGSRNPQAKIFCHTVNKYAEKGDILLSVRAPVGAVNEADQRYGIGRGLCSIRADELLLSRVFVWFLLEVVKVQLNLFSTGSTYEAVAVTDVANLNCLLPPLTEQQAIAQFLDTETVKIDTLIAKKERLIELLKEKRTALISHAVTKGLNPDAPMKDSGVEWLGKIPEGWQPKRLRFCIKVNPVKLEISHLHKSTEVSFVPMENISTDGKISLEKTQTLEDVWQGYTYFRDNDVVVAKITPCYENGKGGFSRNLVNGIAFGTTEIHVLRGSKYIDSQFLFYLTISTRFRSLGISEMTGVAGQQRVPEDFIKDYRTGIPPLTEQQAIAQFLDRETAKIDTLVTKTRISIDKLKEYRTALISAAVTGKIDIRENLTPSPN